MTFSWTTMLPFRKRTACDFCHGDNFKKILAYDDLCIVRCSCGYICMDPYLTEEGSRLIFSEELDKRFPWLKDYELPFSLPAQKPKIFQSYQKVLETLESSLGSPGKILDVGCGRGHFVALAQKRGWEAEGIDFNSMGLHEARKHFDIHVHEGSLGGFKGHEAAYDVVSMWDYLEHVERPTEILNDARKLLRPDGVLVIACPNHHSLLFYLAILIYKSSLGHITKHLPFLYPPTHLSYFSPQWLSQKMNHLGFRKMRIDYDETDLARIALHPIIRSVIAVVFFVASTLSLSNRFTLYLQKIPN